MTFETNFDAKPPQFTGDQLEALMRGESVHVNGVGFTLANLGKRQTKLYGPPAAPGSESFAAYAAAPDAWKAAAATAAEKMGKTPEALQRDLGFDLLDNFLALLKK